MHHKFLTFVFDFLKQIKATVDKMFSCHYVLIIMRVHYLILYQIRIVCCVRVTISVLSVNGVCRPVGLLKGQTSLFLYELLWI